MASAMRSRTLPGCQLVIIIVGHAMSSDPSAWFLAPSEIDASRAGHSRSATGILDISTGNEVVPLINGKAFMAALLVDLTATKAGDSVHSTMFEVNGAVMLDPLAPDPTATMLTKVLVAAIRRNVTVRIIVNQNIYIQTGLAFCQPINAVCSGKTCCVADARQSRIPAAPGGSVHAKTWSFIFPTEVVSYVGSMDITGDRWDTARHDDEPAREREPDDINHFHGWFGNMFRLRGGAAVDVARHFWQEWNDPAPLPFPSREFYHLDKYPWAVPSPGKPGNLTVQTVRTIGCQAATADDLYQNFAPQGEYSFLSAFTKMAQNAKKYIYLEDQFAFYDEAMAIIAAALPHVEAVVIVTDNATAFSISVLGVDVTVASDMRYYRQDVALAPLMQNETLRHKVHIYELAREGYPVTGNLSETWLYTHAKNYIADDQFMLIGSHGLEKTGFTNDIEVSVGVSDLTSGPHSAVGQFRRRIFAEHLRLAPDDPVLGDPMAAIAEFDRQADTGTARVRHYYPEKRGDNWAEDRVYNLYEPDGRCHTNSTVQNATTGQLHWSAM